MNQFAQAAVVAAIGHRPAKGTIHAAAHRTSPQTLSVALRVGGEHTLPANGTNFAAHWVDGGQTFGTDRQPGNIQQRIAADAAVGRKQNGEEALTNSADPDSADPGSVNPDSVNPDLVNPDLVNPDLVNPGPLKAELRVA